MLLFFSMAAYLTYYSRVEFLKNLPAVDTVMPKPAGMTSNGRMAYLVPADSVRTDKLNKKYVLTARYKYDILGERYLATRIDIWVLEESDGMALIDGLILEEPVLTYENVNISAGESVAIIT
ncbi:MAG: hypothetical protein LBC27_07815 [Spirochaetaceae bacterium]|jgi:hypothetical protein|nr:hypothetical protein [Spirochaetaceae bacterium]